MKLTVCVLGCLLLAAVAEQNSAAPRASVRKVVASPSTAAPTAVLFGKEISARAGEELNGKILTPLFERYVKEANVQVTKEDIAAFEAGVTRVDAEHTRELEERQATLEKELENPKLAAAARKQKEEQLVSLKSLLEDERKEAKSGKARKSPRGLAETFIRAWKLNRSLFEKYGGRVIFQQFGPEPLDAYRKFLQEREKAGDFKILDEEAREKFWEYFVNDRMHIFASRAEGKAAMGTPWWLQEKPAR